MWEDELEPYIAKSLADSTEFRAWFEHCERKCLTCSLWVRLPLIGRFISSVHDKRVLAAGAEQD